MATTSPFLRWAGSKKQLFPIISSYWKRDYERYIEPFAGSACIFFGLRPKRALLADMNQHLVDVYRIVRSHPDEVSDSLARLPSGVDEFYRIRALDSESLRPVERAAIFIYLNRYCFNGLYRTNKQGKFNVPYGAAKAGSLPSREHLKTCATLLRRASLKCGDFMQTISDAKRGDFVYMDPPFAVKKSRVFAEYQAKPFGSTDVERLRTTMQSLERKNVKFLVSYLECDEAKYLSRSFDVRRVQVRRHISGFAGARSRSFELLISN